MCWNSLNKSIVCLLFLLLISSAALAQTEADKGKTLPMRRAPELTALVDAKMPGYFVIRDQAQTVPGKTTAIDCNKDMLLAASMGTIVPDSINITIVQELTDRIIAEVNRYYYFGPVLGVNAIPVVDVVAVPKSDKPVYFIVNQYTNNYGSGTKLTGTTTVCAVLYQFSGGQSRIKNPATMVIRDEEAWKALWQDDISPNLPTVKIDFTRQMAVAIFAGSFVGISHLSQDAVIDDEKTLTIAYGLTQEPAERKYPSNNYLVLVIPSSTLPVVFQKTSIQAR